MSATLSHVARDDGRQQPGRRAGQHGGDEPGHRRGHQELLPAPAPDPLHAQPLRRRDAEQIAGQFGRVLKVVAAQPREPACIAEVLDP